MADGALPYVWHPTARDRLRARAQNDVTAAIKRGLLLPPEQCKCKDCGATAECYDHRNYYKPLEVEPVCLACNVRRGPGFPLPTNDDVGRDRNDLKPKGKGIKSAGIRWDMDEGEGFQLPEFHIHAQVNWADLEMIEDIDAETSRNFGAGKLRRAQTRGFRHLSARYDFFKSHDPWRLA